MGASHTFVLRRGMDLPIAGAPAPRIEDADVRQVAVLGTDFVGLKPRLLVAEGDRVALGQPLVEDRARLWLKLRSPATGHVGPIVRGKRRVLQAVPVAIDRADDEHERGRAHWEPLAGEGIGQLPPAEIAERLLESGLWNGLRRRPFGTVADPQAPPSALLISAVDSRPLCAPSQLVLDDDPEAFAAGARALSRLVDAPVYVAHAPDARLPALHPSIGTASFAGPHPAGLPGTHLHFLHPVGPGRHAWTIDLQDTIAIGRLFLRGVIDPSRLVAVGGPLVSEPLILRARLGASLDELLDGRLTGELPRVISGCVLGGRHAPGPMAWLSRWDTQVSVIREAPEKELFGWMGPGLHRHSVLNLFLGALRRRKPVAMKSSTNGSFRALVPLGSYERVMPLDLLPTLLLRSLLTGDLEDAEKLGALELVEEDLGLCTYVDPGKHEFGAALRSVLDRLRAEG